MSATWEIRQGDATEQLCEMPDESVQCCVTSPPFFGLRDYGVDGQIGLEGTPDEFVARLVEVFREVRRVLRLDGTLWLNIGDSYHGGGYANHRINGEEWLHAHGGDRRRSRQQDRINANPDLKPKDLLGIPWLLAFALRADGWYLRSDVIWAKPNPMPESVTDRPTSAHEHVFLLSKSPRYFYDADAIREAQSAESLADHLRRRPSDRSNGVAPDRGPGDSGLRQNGVMTSGSRNKRNVWEIATQPYPDAHFATFPPKLVEPCILAGSSPKVCGECGAPWERVVERGAPLPDMQHRQPPKGFAPGQKGGHVGEGNGQGFRASKLSGQEAAAFRAANPHRHLGWQPSCAHQDDTGHSVILDPFAGAGTTGLVALRHDRSFIGIELSPAYAEMARERIRQDAPLLNTIAESAA